MDKRQEVFLQQLRLAVRNIMRLTGKTEQEAMKLITETLASHFRTSKVTWERKKRK